MAIVAVIWVLKLGVPAFAPDLVPLDMLGAVAGSFLLTGLLAVAVLTRQTATLVDAQHRALSRERVELKDLQERNATLRAEVDDLKKGLAAIEARARSELGLSDEIPVASLAKQFEEVFVPGQPEPIRLPRQSEALYLLQRIRDEEIEGVDLSCWRHALCGAEAVAPSVLLLLVGSEVIRQTVALGAERPAPPTAQKAVSSPAGDKTVVVGDKPKAMPTLGRYEILGQLGRGAMGIVYKGRDPKLNRLTAIKTIRFSDEFDESQVETIKGHFYREAEVVAKLSHTNIVTIFDVGEDLDLSYLAMEYLEGENLEKYTAKENLLSLKKIIDIIAQVCDALAYAHQHDIIHRDIKPANIMMLKDGIVKVTDFGIARATTSTRTRTGIIKGTPYYMSPEQTQGQELTGKSDVFSLGVVFYQLLTGKLPFYGDNMAAIMYQTTSVDPEPPTTFNPEINKPTLAILKRSLGAASFLLRKRIFPEVGSFKLRMVLPAVVFPQPLSPTKPRVSPFLSFREIPSTAFT